MKNFKRANFLIFFLIALFFLVSCKVENRIDNNYFTDGDFSVSCLYGFNYLIRVSSKSFIVPKFDLETGQPERCYK